MIGERKPAGSRLEPISVKLEMMLIYLLMIDIYMERYTRISIVQLICMLFHDTIDMRIHITSSILVYSFIYLLHNNLVAIN